MATNLSSLLVGAPFADYGNRRDVDTKKNFYTSGIDNIGLGEGKVWGLEEKHSGLIQHDESADF